MRQVESFFHFKYPLFLNIFTLLLVWIVVLPLGHATAQDIDGRRTALVIGNTSYEHFLSLPNAGPDAESVAASLRRLNFEVTLGKDLSKEELSKTIITFLRTLVDGDVALFYYSGHAFQIAGRNYILPVDASLDTIYDLEVETYEVSNLLKYMQSSSALQMIILDACRDNPFQTREFLLGNEKFSSEGTKGLADIIPNSRGSLIVYSTAPGRVAYDGKGDNSPFTGAFANEILRSNTEIRDVLATVRKAVIDITDGKQIPWESSSLVDPFYFNKSDIRIIGSAIFNAKVPFGPEAATLAIPEPITNSPVGLTYTILSEPQQGELWLAGEKVESGATFDIKTIGDLALLPSGSKPTGFDVFHYEIRHEQGTPFRGTVSIEYVPAEEEQPDEEPVSPSLLITRAEDPEDTGETDNLVAERFSKRTVSMETEVGTGFVRVADLTKGLIAGAETWLRLSKRDPGAQVALGTQLVDVGALFTTGELDKIGVRPASDAVGQTLNIEFEVAETQTPTPGPLIAMQVAVTVNECDELAAEPLDVQGVSDGVLPNDIDVKRAMAACQHAVLTYPQQPRFKFQLARALYADGRFEEAVTYLREAKEAGHVRAGQLLGRLHQLGAGVDRDPAKAIGFFVEASEKGDPYAQYSLGRAYMEGNGVEQRLEDGVKLLVDAAQNGHTYALNQLGAEYLRGDKVEKDPERAHRFYSESVARGDIWGMVNMGLLYRDGIVVGKDVARAEALFQTAHAEGHPYAGTLIGMLVADRTPEKLVPRLDYFRESASRGDGWGAVFAGEVLRDNPSLQNRPGETIELFGLAAAFKAANPKDRGRKALDGYSRREIASTIQRVLKRVGHYDGAIDGAFGPQSRRALTAYMPDAPSGALADTLVALLWKEWIDGRPRLDLL
ncbi:MAG: caspase family protein [Pseudomonadota bacterium]